MDAAARPGQVRIAPALGTNNAGSTDYTPTDAVGAGDETMPYTCLTCVRRKVKCDKSIPKCSTCLKAKLECEYQAPPPRKRKRKETSTDVYERLAKYEKLLKDNGILIDSQDNNADSKSSPHSPPTTAASTNLIDQEAVRAAHIARLHKTGRLVSHRGKSRYIDSAIWKTIGADALDSSDEEDDSDNHLQKTSGSTSANDVLSPLLPSILLPNWSSTNLTDAHPTYDVAMFLWKTYLSDIEPMTKLLHAPSISKVVQGVAAHPGSASRETECFVFAIYYFATMVLSDEVCRARIHESREVLLARYGSAAVHALFNASVLKTKDLMVVQSYIIFLLASRATVDVQTFWILTGIAVRLAQRIGLHRDGEELGLSPFDTQMRRRAFWQLLPLDGLASQRCGVGITIQGDSWTVKQPLNVEDEDLWPEMTETPTPREGATGMIFCLCRAEVGKFFQRSYPVLGNWSRVWEPREGVTFDDMVRQVDELEKVLEDKFVRFCDLIDPVHCVTNAMARTGMNVARFRILSAHFREWQSKEGWTEADRNTYTKVLGMAHKIIDYGLASYANPLLERFRWHLKEFFQWDAIAFVLKELLLQPTEADPDVIWPKIEKLFHWSPELIRQRQAINAAIGKLIIRAWEINPSHLLAAPGSDPVFIKTLRDAFASKVATPSTIPAASTVTAQATFVPPASNGTIGHATDLVDPAEMPFDHTGMAAAFDMDLLDPRNGENMDWNFWDQLIRDPYAFSRT